MNSAIPFSESERRFSQFLREIIFRRYVHVRVLRLTKAPGLLHGERLRERKDEHKREKQLDR